MIHCPLSSAAVLLFSLLFFLFPSFFFALDGVVVC